MMTSYKMQGLSSAQLQAQLPDHDNDTVVRCLNKLLNAYRLRVFKRQEDDETIFQHVRPEDSAKLKGLSAEDLLIFQTIEQAGNVGIWVRDIRSRTNIAQAKIGRITKNLEERGLVKSVKSVQGTSRKVFMLAGLEPAREITGGPWYSADGPFDTEFTEVLRNAVEMFVDAEGAPTLKSIASHLINSGISTAPLTPDDVALITGSLVYDKKLEKIPPSTDLLEWRQCSEGPDGPSNSSDDERPTKKAKESSVGLAEDALQTKYRIARLHLPEEMKFAEMPCGVCPVFLDCHPSGKISPTSCVYYKKWLDF